MKANEAPEKIYLSLAPFEISDFVTKILTTKEEGNIEYTRTDAFIEKACEWLKENSNRYFDKVDTIFGTVRVVDSEKMVSDFKKAMKGE